MAKSLVLILGPHAVGKMTVGQELAKMIQKHFSLEGNEGKIDG